MAAGTLDLGALGWSLILNTDKFDKGFKDADQDIDTHGNKWKSFASDMQGKVSSGISNSIKAIGTALAGAASAASAGLVELAKTGIEYASDLNEVQNVVDVTFGKNASAIDDWAKKASEAYGMNELQAKQMTGVMGSMLSSMGMTSDQVLNLSENMTGLAGDFASFYNLPVSDAFDKIRAGIAGETEPLKELGINMSDVNLQAYALSQGIQKPYSAMTQGEQAMLRYNYLMSVSSNAQGDFARTSDSFANQQRLLQNNFQALAGSLGQALLPALNSIMETLNKLFTSGAFNGLINVISTTLVPILDKIGSKIAEVLPGLVSALEPLASKLIGFVSSLADTLFPIIVTLFQTLLPPVLDIITQIFTAVQPLLPLIASIVQALIPPLMSLLTPLVSLLSPIIGLLISIANTLLPPIITILSSLISTIMPPLVEIINKVVAAISSQMPLINTLMTAFGSVLTNLFGKFLPPLIDMIMQFVDMLLPLWQSCFQQIVTMLIDALPQVESFIQSLLTVAMTLMQQLMPALMPVIQEILPMFAQILTTVVEAFMPLLPIIGNLISSLLPPLMAILKPIIDLLQPILSLIMPIVDILIKLVTMLIPPLVDIITVLLNILTPIINVIMTIVKVIVEDLIGAIQGLLPVINDFIGYFQGIIDFFTNVFQGNWQGAWDAIKEIFSSIINAIKDVFTGAWKAITGAVANAWDALGRPFEGVFNWVRDTWQRLKEYLSKPIDDAKKAIEDVLKNIWDAVCGPLETAWNWVRDTWNKISDMLSKPIQDAKDLIGGIVDGIKSFFTNLHIEFPAIKTPHFTIEWLTSGTFADIAKVLGLPGFPKIDVSWYGTGGIFNQPQLIGVGEKGPEAVLPIDKLQGMIDQAVNKGGKGDTVITGNNFYIREEADIPKVARQLYQLQQDAERAGGIA